MKKKKKDELDEYKDVTVADMNVEGMPWYRSEEQKKADRERRELNLSAKEKRALIFGAYAALLPYFLIIIGVFCAVFGLIMLYLHFHI